GDERRPGIVGRPPVTGDDLAVRRRRRRKSDAAVAVEHPAHVRRNARLLRRQVAEADEPAAQHRLQLEPGVARLAPDQRLEGIAIVLADVDEEEAWRIDRDRAEELAPEIA